MHEKFLSKKFIRKVLLCTEKGEIVKNESIQDRGLEILSYLTYFSSVQKNIKYDANLANLKNYDGLMDCLKHIQKELLPDLSDEERLIIEKQLTYYQTFKQSLDELTDISNKALLIVERINQLKVSHIIYEEEFQKMQSLILQREEKRNFIEGLMLKNNCHIREKLEDILYDRRHRNILKNYRSEINLIEDEIKALQHSCYSIIKAGKYNFKDLKETLNIDYGKFTVDKYIQLLFDPGFAKNYFKISYANIKNKHSVFSANLRY